MFRRLIDYFANNHLLINFIFVLTIVGGIYYWTETGKQGLPSIEFNVVGISASYPGAAAVDVEYFITRPIEDALKSVEGIKQVNSSSSSGYASFYVEIENSSDLAAVVDNIKTAVQGVALPAEVRGGAQVMQFKTSQMGVLDIAVFNTNQHVLDFASRSTLQDYILALENRLNSLAAVSSITKRGYVKKLLKIEVIPDKLKYYDIPLSLVASKLDSYDLKQPLGKLGDENESEMVVADTDYSPEELKKIILRGNYLSPQVRLGDIARIYHDYNSASISKVNGYQAITLEITKSSSYGILKAVAEIKKQAETFKVNNPEINLVYLNDKSVDVQDRISLVGNNGIIGFVLILFTLFLLLDFTSGFWVAVSLPFSFAFTMVVSHYLGYTINNVTLAGVIIVMGMIVDDAIVIAENIVRKKKQGISRNQAVVEGTSEMLLPVTAAVITTCVAFLPMFKIEGRFAQLASAIPAMVIIMLISSWLESVFLLPGHMNYSPPTHFGRWLKKFFTKKPKKPKKFYRNREDHAVSPRPIKSHDWFSRVEDVYSRILLRLLRFRYLILLFSLIILGGAGYHLIENMKFVMFPNAGADQVYIFGQVKGVGDEHEAEKKVRKVEEIIRGYTNEVVSFSTRIGISRRSEQAKGNTFSIDMEVFSHEKIEKPISEFVGELKEAFQDLPDLEVNVYQPRFGGSSEGGHLEIIVLDNNDKSRSEVVNTLKEAMDADPELSWVDVYRENINQGYAIKIKQPLTELAGLNVNTVLSALRTSLNGRVIKEIPENNENIDLILSIPDTAKSNVSQILNFPVGLGNGKTSPLSLFAEVTPYEVPVDIYRENFHRVGRIFAGIEDYSTPPASDDDGSDDGASNSSPVSSNFAQEGGATNFSSALESAIESAKTGVSNLSASLPSLANGNGSNRQNFLGSAASPPASTEVDTPDISTPLEIAERYEREVFPQINARYPNAIIYFDGEVKESRESQNDFEISLAVVLFTMYMVLALLFHSLLKPLIVMIIIPFGLVGVVLAFYLHNITNYGFFGLIGFLGLAGVVVNDTIVMVARFEERKHDFHQDNLFPMVADAAKTRLRAIIMTSVTTVAGLFPTVYGWAGYDPLLAEMMFVMAWGLVFTTFVTLILLPCLYCVFIKWQLDHPSYHSRPESPEPD